MSVAPIETDRLRIRAFVPEDWRAVHAYAADPATMAYVPPGALSEDETRAFVAENVDEDARALAVTLRADDRPIGHLVFHPWFAHRTHEIGWVLNARFRGQGFATEGAHALLRHAFETLGLHRVIATCQPENVASWRVMEKLGMRREGHFRQCIYRDETTWWDEYFYAILADEWFQDGSTNLTSYLARTAATVAGSGGSPGASEV